MMRRLLTIALILILAGCAAQQLPTAVSPPATTPPAPATVRAAIVCQSPLGLSAFPQGTLATINAVDGRSINQWQLAVDIEGTLVVSATSREYDVGIITETMRVSGGRASAGDLKRLQSLIGSAEFAALEPCYQNDISDGGSMSFQARSPRGVKSVDVRSARVPAALDEIWLLMHGLAQDAVTPVSTCVQVIHSTAAGHRETALKSCE